MILCIAATAMQLELLSPLILGLHVMWKTLWAGSISSSDGRGFTCQLVFIIPSWFVVYSTQFSFSYVENLPVAVFLFFLFFYKAFILTTAQAFRYQVRQNTQMKADTPKVELC